MSKISAVVSDVDGTLVTRDKRLTPATRDAVLALQRAGLKFTIVSSRPPRGMRALIEGLALTDAIAGFNGGVVATPALATIEQHLIPPEAAHRAAEMLQQRGPDIWAFSGNDWLVRDAAAPLVDHERHTVGFEPTVVASLDAGLDAAAKIVGVSNDYDLLARCERELQRELADGASVARSQLYYLDITHRLANKGAALQALARALGVDPQEIATIGDGPNDVAMFERSGLSIAMGNASAEVKARATQVTDSNEADGFAKA